MGAFVVSSADKTLAVLLFYLFSCLPITASEIDTLILQNSQNDPSKVVAALKKISSEELINLPAEVLIKASYATAIKVEISLTMTLTNALLEHARMSNNNTYKGQAYYNRGAVFAAAGNHDLALDSLLLSLASFENDVNKRNIARTKGALGLMYVEIKEYELAKPYFEEALAFHSKNKDKRNMAMVLQNRGFMKIQLKQFSEAKQDLLNSLEFSKASNLKPNFPILYKNLGKVASERGNFELALGYFEKAIQESTTTGLQYHQSEILRELAGLQLKNKLLNEARGSILKSLDLATQFNLLKQLKESYLMLANIEVANNDYKAAFEAKEKAYALSDKMGDSRVAANLSRLDRYTATLKEQNKRLVLEKEKEIATLAMEREYLLRNFSILVAVAALLLAAYFIWRFSHSNKQAALYEQQSKIDALTCVWNRRAGEAQLKRLCTREAGTANIFSLAVLDIDHFKQVNDNFGHDVGDKVIVTLCDIIQQSLRPTDMLCRWGGEEFILILEKFNAGKAFEICERIRLNIERSPIEGVGYLTVSIGISMFEDDDLTELIKRGDEALYHAKAQGRNQVVIKNKPKPDFEGDNTLVAGN